MRCLKSPSHFEEAIKKSRFIGIIQSAVSDCAVVDGLRRLQMTHPNANHIAFAYRLKTDQGIVTRCHDAGEPSGTAGKPILMHIEGKDLVNVLLVVVRYFGGVKLGAGGLTRAYGHIAKKAIQAAELVEYVEYETLNLCIDYSQTRNFAYQLRKLDGEIVNQDYSDRVSVVVRIPAGNATQLSRLFLRDVDGSCGPDE